MRKKLNILKWSACFNSSIVVFFLTTKQIQYACIVYTQRINEPRIQRFMEMLEIDLRIFFYEYASLMGQIFCHIPYAEIKYRQFWLLISFGLTIRTLTKLTLLSH